MKVELLNYTPNPEELIAKAGKLCYSPVGIKEIEDKLSPEEISKFVGHIVDINHQSVTEHVSFTFGIEGISRITEIQFARHRIGNSLSVQSGRYVNRGNPDFVTPKSIQNCQPALDIYDKIIADSVKAYNDLFLILMLRAMGYNDKGIEEMNYDNQIKIVSDLKENNISQYKQIETRCVEDARYAHLQSICTKAVITMNARSLLHFFELRCCTRAQLEIRTLANKMLKLVKEVAPTLFSNAGATCEKGFCTEGSKTCGKLDSMKGNE